MNKWLKRRLRDDKKGFTLIELILVIAIIAIIAAATVPILGNFNQRTQIDSVARQAVSALRLAQQKSMTVENDSQFGVYFNDLGNEFIVFRGSTYGSFPAEDRVFSYPDSVTISESFTSDEVNFEKRTGTTLDTSSITITNNTGLSFTITIGAQGKIEL